MKKFKFLFTPFVALSLILLFLISPALHASLESKKQQITVTEKETPPCVIVVFGATGDLMARKLMPALYNLFKDGYLSQHTIIIGVARKEKTNEMFRAEMQQSIERFSPKTNDIDFWKDFSAKIFYQPMEFDQAKGYKKLDQLLKEVDQNSGTQGNRIYYLATPPSNFAAIVENLKNNDLIYGAEDQKWSRVLIEKPFGYDLESAQKLQSQLLASLSNDQLYRIDHYLGKEGVQRLLEFRLDSGLFEPFWNHQNIDFVQLTLSEEIGIGTRGEFWEHTGYLRDIFQNHLMQLLALIAMDLPNDQTTASLAEEKIKALKAICPIPINQIDRFVVRGQYKKGNIQGTQVIGYQEEQGVAPQSDIETFVAAKLFIHNERWKGVPFYIRGGKRLPYQTTEIAVSFKNTLNPLPHLLVKGLVIRIQPNPGIFLLMESKLPLGQPRSGTFQYDLSTAPPLTLEGYGKLIYDSIRGNKLLFVTYAEQLAAWELLTPVLTYWNLHKPPPAFFYPAGTWGPMIIDSLILDENHQWYLLQN